MEGVNDVVEAQPHGHVNQARFRDFTPAELFAGLED